MAEYMIDEESLVAIGDAIRAKAKIEDKLTPSEMVDVIMGLEIVPPPTAFAVYSADDDSLSFYKQAEVPESGDMFNGKTATGVYADVETAVYESAPWDAYKGKIKKIVVADALSPTSTAHWFDSFTAMTSCDVAKLDTSNVTDMDYMFNGCSAIKSLDISKFTTSKVQSMTDMFAGMTGLQTIHLGSKFSFNGATFDRLCVLVSADTMWANTANPMEQYTGDNIPNKRDVTWGIL